MAATRWEQITSRALAQCTGPEPCALVRVAAYASEYARPDAGAASEATVGGMLVADVLKEFDRMIQGIQEQKREVAALRRERNDALQQHIHASGEIEKLRSAVEQSKGAHLRTSESMAHQFLGRLMQSCSHRSLSSALARWREASQALTTSTAFLIAGKRSRAVAVMLTTSAGGSHAQWLRRLGGALRVWAAAAMELHRAHAMRAAKQCATTTRMVRSCYATDKLGIALGVTGARLLCPLGMAVGPFHTHLLACACSGHAKLLPATSISRERAESHA